MLKMQISELTCSFVSNTGMFCVAIHLAKTGGENMGKGSGEITGKHGKVWSKKSVQCFIISVYKLGATISSMV